MSNKLTQTALELLMIEGDLPCRLDYEEVHPTLNDFEIHIFEQTWGSTALGFGGMGGQAMTDARTYVFIPVTANQKCFVYFAGRFAYAVPYSETFIKDVINEQMAPVYRRGKYCVEGTAQ